MPNSENAGKKCWCFVTSSDGWSQLPPESIVCLIAKWMVTVDYIFFWEGDMKVFSAVSLKWLKMISTAFKKGVQKSLLDCATHVTEFPYQVSFVCPPQASLSNSEWRHFYFVWCSLTNPLSCLFVKLLVLVIFLRSFPPLWFSLFVSLETPKLSEKASWFLRAS